MKLYSNMTISISIIKNLKNYILKLKFIKKIYSLSFSLSCNFSSHLHEIDKYIILIIIIIISYLSEKEIFIL